MTNNDTAQHLNDWVQSLPKVELHRHLEGSLRLRTMVELARTYSIALPGTEQLRPLVQVVSDEAYSFRNFLSKFQTLRLFYRTPEIIQRVTREAVEDAAADGVRYMELRFTPVALARAQNYPLGEVMDWVCAAAQEAEANTGTMVRLLASFNRHEPVELAEQVARLAAERRSQGIVGVDISGNEAEFSALPFAGVLREAREAGLPAAVHAGEWGGPENVREAIVELNAGRIGHGVRVLEDPTTTALARERAVPFEVCVTSNMQSGVTTDLCRHPLVGMLAAGLNVTINTDDPSISQICLSDEYRLVVDELGLSLSFLKERILAAARAAFLPEAERIALVERLRKELS